MKSEKTELSEKQQQLLLTQEITELTPGTLLHDFAVLLDFVAAHDLVATGQHQMLPLAALEPLNARLAKPLTLDLKRPLLKSFPHIGGLFLLARAAGFLLSVPHPNGQPNGKFLRLDAAAFEQWQTLNLTERYFTLLETYLAHAMPEMIGERMSWMDMPGMRNDCVMVWERIGPKGIQVPEGKASDNLIYKVWLHHFALLELFGFIHIKSAPPLPGKGWNITQVRQTPFGEAMITVIKRGTADYLSHLLNKDWEEEEEETEETEEAPSAPLVFNLYQPDFQLYFPAWQCSLVQDEQRVFTDGVYQFKVSLGKIWRRIAIPATETLVDLSDAILKAVKFDNDHLHCFEYKNRFGVTTRVNHDALDEGPYTHQVRVGDLPLAPGAVLKYTFDFGDNWQFEILLESIVPPDKKLKHARLLESNGKAPEQYPSWEE